jgi:site-specific DNA-methyltransferase (adenine-specific)
MCEYAWMSFQKPAKIFRLHVVTAENNKIHPTQKPVTLYKWLLTNYAKQGDKILDTHLGSGSSRIAAYDLGFDFTGFELDKDYYDAQEKRFNDFKLQLKLF